ncbi:MAG: hypothetical protein EAY75_15720, partial [Bacteroidetes bacterium]
MPHLHKNQWVATEAELVPQHYATLNALQCQIADYEKVPFGIKKVQSGGNGRKLLVLFASLPTAVQQGLGGQPTAASHPLLPYYAPSADALAFYTTHKINGQHLRAPYVQQYLVNASVLAACVALKAAREAERKSKGGSLLGIMATLAADCQSLNPHLLAQHGVQHTLPASERWFKADFTAFCNQDKGYNYAALISNKHGNQHRRKVTTDVLALLNDLFAGCGTKPTRTQVSSQYAAFLTGHLQVLKNNSTGECYNPANYKPLGTSTIVDYLGQWQEAIANQPRRGNERIAMVGRFTPYHSLSRPQFAGSIITIDDRQPPFCYAEGQRVWFYNGLDVASNAFVCWVYGRDKKGIIIDFYRQLVRNYTAWGLCLPYELEAESNLNSGFKNSFLAPGYLFGKVRIEANNPRGKYMESIYRQQRYAPAEKDQPGWRARPHARAEANQGPDESAPLVPYDRIVTLTLQAIQDWNNSPHETEPGLTRWEYFLQHQHPNLKPTNWAALLPLLRAR